MRQAVLLGVRRNHTNACIVEQVTYPREAEDIPTMNLHAFNSVQTVNACNRTISWTPQQNVQSGVLSIAAVTDNEEWQMTVLEKVKSAVMPVETEEARTQARAKAKAAAAPGSWLGMVIGHHEKIESAFAAVKAARDASARTTAQKRLAILLTGHSIAEESVLYPALVAMDQKGHAATAYMQQSEAKTEMAELEKLSPMGHDYLEKLEHIHTAVAHHVFEEEGTWFPALLKKASAADQVMLAKRYTEEYERYVDGNID
jgi:hypothetical protein